MHKQIEKMAKDIRIAETEYMVSMLTADIDDMIDGAAPRNERLATALYEKGYRKSTDIAREIIENVKKLIIQYRKGDISEYRLFIKLEELQQKYESEEADDV